MSTRTKTTDQPLYLRIAEDRSDRSGRYYHLTARVCARKYEQGAGHVPYGVDDEYDSGYKYSDLQLRAQGDDQTQRAATVEQAVYGWQNDLEYHEPYRCGLRTVSRMYKTLSVLHKRLNKIAERRGHARSYPEYCGRLAEALGCEGIVVERSAASRNVTGVRWDWCSIGDGVNRIAGLIHAWQREAQPAPAAAGEQEAAS